LEVLGGGRDLLLLRAFISDKTCLEAPNSAMEGTRALASGACPALRLFATTGMLEDDKASVGDEIDFLLLLTGMNTMEEARVRTRETQAHSTYKMHV
jgi:hypothetical protein